MFRPEKTVSPMDFVPNIRGKKTEQVEEDMRDWPAEKQAEYIKNLFRKKIYNKRR